MADENGYMCENRIVVSLEDLERNSGNLKYLTYYWGYQGGATKSLHSVIYSDEIIKSFSNGSQGYSAEVVEDCIEETTDVALAMQALLENSLAFFESVGIRFEDADVRSANEISQINFR